MIPRAFEEGQIPSFTNSSLLVVCIQDNAEEAKKFFKLGRRREGQDIRE